MLVDKGLSTHVVEGEDEQDNIETVPESGGDYQRGHFSA